MVDTKETTIAMMKLFLRILFLCAIFVLGYYLFVLGGAHDFAAAIKSKVTGVKDVSKEVTAADIVIDKVIEEVPERVGNTVAEVGEDVKDIGETIEKIAEVEDNTVIATIGGVAKNAGKYLKNTGNDMQGQQGSIEEETTGVDKNILEKAVPYTKEEIVVIIKEILAEEQKKNIHIPNGGTTVLIKDTIR